MRSLLWSAGIFVLSASVVVGQTPPPPVPNAPTAAAGPSADGGDGVEVLARGPVHEGFAGPTTGAHETGMIVPRQPPAPVDELPPDEKPNEDAVWIPGYWAWDDDANDYLWVSGIWRVIPPGFQWVSGYWSQVDGGWQWVAGFWAPEQQQQAQYLPEPPASLDVGPNTPSPSPNSFWVSGYWNWSGATYAWRPGFWSVVQPDWIWVPPYYTWTPSGYVFTGGYWDYPMATRGWLYAPVYFQRTVWSSPGFCYRPAYQINVNIVINNFFCRPRARHYYFGDYYDARYAGRGFAPWYDFHGGKRGYDPLFNYYNWKNSRTNPQWAATMRQDYARRREFVAERPPRTFAQQQTMALQAGAKNVQFQPIVQVKGAGDKMILRDAKDLQRAQAVRNHAQLARTERARLETLTPDLKRSLDGKKTAREVPLPKTSTVIGARTTGVQEGRGKLDGAVHGFDGTKGDRKRDVLGGKLQGGKASPLGTTTGAPNQGAKPRMDGRRDLLSTQKPPIVDPKAQKLGGDKKGGKVLPGFSSPDATRNPQVRPVPEGSGKGGASVDLTPRNGKGGSNLTGPAMISKDGKLGAAPKGVSGPFQLGGSKQPQAGVKLYPPANNTPSMQPREFKAKGQTLQQPLTGQPPKPLRSQPMLQGPSSGKTTSSSPGEPPKGKEGKLLQDRKR